MIVKLSPRLLSPKSQSASKAAKPKIKVGTIKWKTTDRRLVSNLKTALKSGSMTLKGDTIFMQSSPEVFISMLITVCNAVRMSSRSIPGGMQIYEGPQDVALVMKA